MSEVRMPVVKLGFLLTFLCGSLLCQGQSKRATVVVEVTDPGGAGVPRAEMKLSPTPPQNGSGQLETASDGKLTLKLKPGNYNLSVSCAGFKTFSKRFTVRETDEIQALSVGLRIADTGSPEVYPVAQQQREADANGVIHGTVFGQDGKPAKGIGLDAWPLGVALAAKLPHTKTNDVGEYRFEQIPWWGKYTVYAEDEGAGYSLFSTREGHTEPQEVELTPEHPEAEMKVYLPPKAGFLHILLTNRRTGTEIPGMQVTLAPMESPEQPVFSMSCYSNRVILIPPDKNLLLHVTSDGYREWDESAGRGKELYLASGARITLDIQLDPLD